MNSGLNSGINLGSAMGAGSYQHYGLNALGMLNKRWKPNTIKSIFVCKLFVILVYFTNMFSIYPTFNVSLILFILLF